MKQPLRLLDMLALKTLAAGVALVQGSPAAGFRGSDNEGMHSSQFQHFLDDSQSASPQQLASDIYRLAARTNFAAPGFALLRQSKIDSSRAQRQSLVELKQNLSQIHQAIAGQPLGWFSINRFNQKNTTRAHRDGGPVQSLLLLGYEPSQVESDLWIADYSACAYQLGLSPVQFLEEFNPMYKKGMNHLAPYTMPILEFDPSYYHILVINNSSTPLNRQEGYWQGVLHGADVWSKAAGSRVINSTSVCPLAPGETEAVSEEIVEQFLTSDKLNETAY